MKITYTLTDEDLKKYIVSDLSTKNKTIPKMIIFIGSFILVVILLMALIAKDYSFALMPAVFLAIAYFILKSPKFFKAKYLKSINTNDERIIEVNENSLTVTNPTRTTSYKFSEIKEVNLANDYFVFIKFNPGDSVLIPKSAFSTKNEMIDFINRIKSYAKLL